MGKSYQKGWVSIRGMKWYGLFSPHYPRCGDQSTEDSFDPGRTWSEVRDDQDTGATEVRGRNCPAHWADHRRWDGQERHRHLWMVCSQPLSAPERGGLERRDCQGQEVFDSGDLVDEFEEIRLENFDKFTLQNHLNRLAKTRSKDRVLQIRSYMRAIFAEQSIRTSSPKILRVWSSLRPTSVRSIRPRSVGSSFARHWRSWMN